MTGRPGFLRYAGLRAAGFDQSYLTWLAQIHWCG